MQITLKPGTVILAAINLFVYLLSWLPNFGDLVQTGMSVIPARFLGTDDVIGKAVSFIPVWLTLFTAPFVSNGLFDFLVSTLLLLLLGNLTERVLDWRGIFVLYFGGALTSALILTLLLPNSLYGYPTSFNAVSSITAAYLLFHPVGDLKGWGKMTAEQARPLQLLLLWFILNLAMGFPSTFELLTVNVLAPVAAFGAGLLLARPLLLWKYKNV
jgi:membrane associated rhomboid family serine protease